MRVRVSLCVCLLKAKKTGKLKNIVLFGVSVFVLSSEFFVRVCVFVRVFTT